MNIVFCGDLCPGGMLAYQDHFIDQELIDRLSFFDLRVCTLEGAIGTNLPYEPSKLAVNGGNNNICYIRDEDFFRIKKLNINLVSLANNHSLDLGEIGLENTLNLLKDHNIKYCGAGYNIDEASEPAVFYDKDGKSIAFFAFCVEGTFPYSCNVAGKNKPGIYKTTIENIIGKVKDLSKCYDTVILLPHWGKEHSFFPPIECKNYAKKLVSAGASAIFGSHSHIYSPYSLFKNKIVCYGMGNFLFPDFMMEPPRPMFYPQNIEDVRRFRRVRNYPSIVKEPSISVWDRESRIGMNWTVCVGNGKVKKFEYFLTELSPDNVVFPLKKKALFKNIFLRFVKIPFGNAIVNCIFYSFIYRLYKKIL